MRHFAESLGQLRIFGDQLGVTDRQGQMVGQVMLERTRREAHTLQQPGLAFGTG